MLLQINLEKKMETSKKYLLSTNFTGPNSLVPEIIANLFAISSFFFKSFPNQIQMKNKQKIKS